MPANTVPPDTELNNPMLEILKAAALECQPAAKVAVKRAVFEPEDDAQVAACRVPTSEPSAVSAAPGAVPVPSPIWLTNFEPDEEPIAITRY